jgi:hypothetical protein
MAQMKKPSVSGKTVKTTTYSLLKPFKKDVKMVNERTTRKPATPRPGPLQRPRVKPTVLPSTPKPPKPARELKAVPPTRSSSKPAAKTKKPLTSSEKAFLEGQKKKAQITKKTGIYPNTAN